MFRTRIGLSCHPAWRRPPACFLSKRRPDFLSDPRQFLAASGSSPSPGVVLNDQSCPLDRRPGKGRFVTPILPPSAGPVRASDQCPPGPGGASLAKPLLRLRARPVSSLDGHTICGMEPGAGWNDRESSRLPVVERIVTSVESRAGKPGATRLELLARTRRSGSVERNAVRCR